MTLHSQIIGEGRPLLILHGFLGMGDNWKTLGNQFADDGFEVHLIDQRNHGRSFHSEDFNYTVMANDLKNYCDAHHLSHISLLGHSMGGKTAMEFAMLYPEIVDKLIIADIGPKAYPQHHQDILKSLASLDFDVLASRGEADKVLAHYIPEIGTRQFLLKNLYWVKKGRLGLRVNLPVVTKHIAQVGKAMSIDAVYKGETLFVRGANSGYIEDIDALVIKKQFPKAVIKTVENAGHWLHAENPTQFYQIVNNFL